MEGTVGTSGLGHIRELQAVLPASHVSAMNKKRKRSDPENIADILSLSPEKCRKKMSHMIPSEKILRNRYKVQEKLGEGTFSVVYSALDVHKGFEEVALKVDKGSSVSSFEREISILDVVKSIKFFPTMLKHFVDPEHGKIIVMDRLGEPLRVRQSKKLTTSLILDLCIQAFDRIQALHMSGVIHRDIKPNNFIFDREHNINNFTSTSGKLYLVDFGLVRYLFEYFFLSLSLSLSTHTHIYIYMHTNFTLMYRPRNLLKMTAPYEVDVKMWAFEDPPNTHP